MAKKRGLIQNATRSKATPKMQATVQPIHFPDLGGNNFERLVFAFHLRAERFVSLEWYGQAGNDKGRDIIGDREGDPGRTERVVIACANWRRLSLTKAKKDIDKMAADPANLPDVVRFVAGGIVSSTLRDKIKLHAKNKSIHKCEVWSGSEFEERVRHSAESLLKRFMQGEEFPDTPADLVHLIDNLKANSDEERLTLFGELFDRPAFYTPWEHEVSARAFVKAIEDTVAAINTGVHRMRDGTEIRRIPSRGQLEDPATRKAMKSIEQDLTKLGKYVTNVIDGSAPYPQDFAADMNRRRTVILDSFRLLLPSFDITVADAASWLR